MVHFWAKRWTVVGRKWFMFMLTFTIRSVQISKTWQTVRFLILYAIVFCLRNFAVSTYDSLRIPISSVIDHKFSIILPLILSWISNHIFVWVDSKLLLSGTHIDCIKLFLILKKILSRETMFCDARKYLWNGYFEKKYSIHFVFGILEIYIESTSFENQIFAKTIFDADSCR